MLSRNQHECRAVFLTALATEYEAFASHVIDRSEVVHPRGTVYEVGRFTGHESVWRVALVQTDAGNENAAFEAERAIEHFNPSVVMFVGIAGGLKDVAIGDVVAATEVYGFESGADEDRFRPRQRVGRSSYSLIQRARAEARKHDWLRRAGDPAERPSVLVEPIAAGAKVVKSTRSVTYGFLRSTYDRAVAVEMEGIGFLTATHARQDVEALVVRGVSDLLDDKSRTDASGSQDLAARHAAAFAFEVLAKLRAPRARDEGFIALPPAPADEPGVLEWWVPPEEGFDRSSGLGGIGALRLLVEPEKAFRHPVGVRQLGAVLEQAARSSAEAIGRYVRPELDPKTFDWLTRWEARGSVGWKSGKASTNFETLKNQVLVASTYTFNRSAFSTLVTLLVVEPEGNKVAYEHLWVAEALALLQFAAQFYAAVDPDLPLRIDLGLNNLDGAVSWKASRGRAFHSSQTRIADASYHERARALAGPLAADPRPVVQELFDRWFVGFLEAGDDIIGDVGRGAEDRLG